MMSELKEALGPVLKVLGELGGRFVFTDDEGRQFVVAAAGEWEKVHGKQPEVVNQKSLPLPTGPVSPLRSFVVRPPAGRAGSRADELLDRINREIALFQTESVAEAEGEAPAEPTTADDLGISEQEEQAPAKVKFEPLKGDLPPDLQG